MDFKNLGEVKGRSLIPLRLARLVRSELLKGGAEAPRRIRLDVVIKDDYCYTVNILRAIVLEGSMVVWVGEVDMKAKDLVRLAELNA